MRTADRLSEMVRTRNREIAGDAALKAGLGILFTIITFGLVYWFGWFVGVLIARLLNLHAWQFGVIFTALFFAWRFGRPGFASIRWRD